MNTPPKEKLDGFLAGLTLIQQGLGPRPKFSKAGFETVDCTLVFESVSASEMARRINNVTLVMRLGGHSCARAEVPPRGKEPMLGYELVEGSLKNGRIHEMRRVSYAPSSLRAGD